MQKLALGIAHVAVNQDKPDLTLEDAINAPIEPLGPDFKAPTVGEAVAEVVSKVRENVVFRRLSQLKVDGPGFIAR